MTPFGPDDVDPTDDELSPEDEAGVRAILASLPDPPLPDDVRERITAALRAEGNAGAGTGARTVTPLGPRRSHRAPTRRTPRLLQAAAAVAVLAVGGAAVVAVVGQGDDGAPTGGPGTVVAAPPTPGPITSSGTDYTAENVPTLVTSLLTDGAPAATPTPTPEGQSDQDAPAMASSEDNDAATADSAASGDSLASAGGTKKKNKKKNQDSANLASSDGPEAMSESSGGSGGGQSDAESSAGADTAAESAAVTALVQDPTSRAACIATLSGASGTVALSIDVGTYEGRPAAVFVLTDQVNTTRADVWVVGPTCSDADNPFPYSYYNVALP